MTVTTFIRVVYLICIIQLNDSFKGVGGGGELLPPKRGSSRCMTTLNEEYKGRVSYCSPLASVVCKLLDFNLLLWNHLAKLKPSMVWMFIEWFPTKLVLLFQKMVFPYYIWILIMSSLRTKGDIYCFSLIFFFCFRFFCFFSAEIVRAITFLSFQIGQWYLICGCMNIRRIVMTFLVPWPLTWRSNNCFLNSIFLSGP